MNGPQCTAITKKGTRCPNRVMPGRDLCFTHDPALAERRKAGQREGGYGKRTQNRIKKRIPTDIRSTLDILFETLEGVRDGTILPAQAQAIATVSRAIVSAWEVGAVEQKLRELEARVDAKSPDSPHERRVA